jgi:hypothetical protein
MPRQRRPSAVRPRAETFIRSMKNCSISFRIPSSKLSSGLVSQICMPAPIIFPMSISTAAMTLGGPWPMKPGTWDLLRVWYAEETQDRGC